MRFKAEDIVEAEARADMRYIIELKDGRLFKLRRLDMDADEVRELTAFFLK